jgi:hypothetical protein
MLKRVVVLVLLALVVVPQFAMAEEAKPIQLAVFNPVQLVPETGIYFRRASQLVLHRQ